MSEKTKVLFVKDEYNDVVAVFPYDLGTNNSETMSCYAHIGQHSSCHSDWVVSSHKNVAPNEYSDLKEELESIGYELEILTRFPNQKSYQYRINCIRALNALD
jgi:hypothetical protein